MDQSRIQVVAPEDKGDHDWVKTLPEHALDSQNGRVRTATMLKPTH
jgi:hypothetical protein